MATNRDQIRTALLAEVDRAGIRYQLASDNLREVTSEIPSQIPHPDGILRIEKAGQEHRAAIEALRRALSRWNAFTMERQKPG